MMKKGIDQFVETVIGVLFFYQVDTQMCKQEDDTFDTMGMWSWMLYCQSIGNAYHFITTKPPGILGTRRLLRRKSGWLLNFIKVGVPVKVLE